MKPSGLSFVVIGFACTVMGRAADATTPVDYTQRNGNFAPSASISPEKSTPTTNSRVQEKRVDKAVVDKTLAPVGERRAPVDVTERREKQVREKTSQRPQAEEQPKSGYNHRASAISTANDTVKPPTVTKYQESLVAASSTNMARYPAMDQATAAKINRFVFRKNPVESGVAAGSAPVTPAAGGAGRQN
jgi:hypothetical protein